MAKKSERQPIRHNKDRSGCIWGLISIFDFRHGRTTTRKLISDRRHGNGIRRGGNGHTRNKPETLTCLDENIQDNEESKAAATGDSKPCVKELMAEEMASDQDERKEKTNAEIDPEESKSFHDGQVKKRHKKRKKSWSRSVNKEIDDLGAPDNFGSECCCTRNLNKRPIENLNIYDMMKEFCRQIHQKDVRLEMLDQTSDVAKLGETIKEFVNQEVIHNRRCMGDGSNDDSTELVDAFQILSLDEDLFLKITQDPNSPLVKYVKKWLEIQGDKDENSDVLPASSLFECHFDNLRTSKELFRCRRKLFRRMVRSEEKIPSSGSEDTDASKRIVILKPVPTGPQGSEIGSISNPESHNSVQSKEKNERVSSYMFLKKIKGKIKNAMGKEHHEISSTRTVNKSCNQHRDMGDGSNTTSDDSIENSPPGKDHLFVEKIAKSSTCFRRGESHCIDKVKVSNINNEPEIAGNSSQRVSDIYTEAKMHLSEMLSNEDGDSDTSSLPTPKTLGGILSLPEYKFCPTNSPGSDMGHHFGTTLIPMFSHESVQKVNEDTQCHNREDKDSHPAQSLQSRPDSCVSMDDRQSKMQTLDRKNPEITDELLSEGGLDSIYRIIDEMYTDGATDVTGATTDGFQEDDGHLEAFSEPISHSITGDEQTNSSSEFSIEREQVILSLDQEYYEDDQMTYRKSPSVSASSLNKKTNEKEAASFAEERSSPVSVLEPSLVEDDISPKRSICQPELPMQPLQIQFEEYDTPATDHSCYLQTCVEEKESVFEYVNAILKACCLKWDDPYMISLSSDHLLNPSLLNELQFSNKLHSDQKLIFDVTNEVLINVLEGYLGCSPWVSFLKPGIRPLPNMENATIEVSEGVCWHLLQLPLPRSLDQIVRKDMARCGSWMDLRCAAERVGVGMEEVILEDLVEDTIFSCLYQQGGDLALPVEFSVREDSKCECKDTMQKWLTIA